MPVWTRQQALTRLPSGAYDQTDDLGANQNARIMELFQQVFWAEVNDFYDGLLTHHTYKNAPNGSLDNFSRDWKIIRRALEGDASLRIRLAGRLQQLVGPPTPDAICAFVEAILGAQPGDIGINENGPQGNDPPGAYEPATYRIQFDFTLLATLGFTPSQYAGAIASVDTALDLLSAAGVRGEVFVPTGAQWDSAVWDVDSWAS